MLVDDQPDREAAPEDARHEPARRCSVLGFYRRRMRDETGVIGQSGAVSVVQRASADLRLNPHWHAILLDGVFAPDGQGALVFHQLPNLDDSRLADLLQVIRVRVLGYLERRGVIENQAELAVLDGDFCEREPALAQLAAAALSGLTPAVPRSGVALPSRSAVNWESRFPLRCRWPSSAVPTSRAVGDDTAKVVAIPRLKGLHHDYQVAA